MEFLAQRREGAKIVNSLTLRLRVRLFFRLSAHAVSYKSQIGGIHRKVSGSTRIKNSFFIVAFGFESDIFYVVCS